MTATSGFVEIEATSRLLRIEHQWIARERGNAPLIVFLHEGLGSVSMWKDFPKLACEAAGCRGLVYSRPGYGRSTPRPPDEAWAIDFMHRQAHDVLPALLRALGVDTVIDRPWLFGHSDGGSIALLHAARFPTQVAGTIVMAPHIMVEAFGLASIRAAREAYHHGTLRAGLARHHDDPDSAFTGWNDIWLAPTFVAWNIETELANIRCPLLAIQGEDDPYGTMAQIDGILARAPQTELVKLPSCGHSPHRDQPEAVMAAASRFIQRHPSWT
ncbi:MAG: alpha/beta hydrolase [Bacteriovorax sp.]|nr:alpha/beta hydrolase [Rhizobacter sp.]